MNQKILFKQGVRAGLPICCGYLPAAMAFGLLAKTTGLSILESFLFSGLVFAGASQFMALNLLSTGAAVMEIIVATFLLNLRHLLMSASLAARFLGKGIIIPAVAFGVTDETFSVAALRPGNLRAPFLLGLELISYSGWVSGTVIGYLIGAALPPALRGSMGIVLYALFIALLIPPVKKIRQYGYLALGAGAIHYLLTYSRSFPPGWNLIAAILISAAVGAMILKPERKEG